jgi:hypothetical protein
MAWHPTAWLMTTQVFRPMATQRSYSAVKSAVVMAGGCLGQVDPSLRAPTSPLTMIAHVGELGEAEG